MITIPDFVEITEDAQYIPLLREAYRHAELHSTDKSTKNAALIINNKGEIIGRGVSGLHPSFRDIPERHERPLKYPYTRHAERDAIYDAADKGNATRGTTMIVPWYACTGCSMGLVSSNIETIVGHFDMLLKSPEHWKEDIEMAFGQMHEKDIKMKLYKGTIGDVRNLMNGSYWNP